MEKKYDSIRLNQFRETKPILVSPGPSKSPRTGNKKSVGTPAGGEKTSLYASRKRAKHRSTKRSQYRRSNLLPMTYKYSVDFSGKILSNLSGAASQARETRKRPQPRSGGGNIAQGGAGTAEPWVEPTRTSPERAAGASRAGLVRPTGLPKTRALRNEPKHQSARPTDTADEAARRADRTPTQIGKQKGEYELFLTKCETNPNSSIHPIINHVQGNSAAVAKPVGKAADLI